MLRNPCKECAYYCESNNTCQSKKVATSGSGFVTVIDRLFCKPYIPDDSKLRKVYKPASGKDAE